MSTQFFDKFRRYSKFSGFILTREIDIGGRIASFTFLFGIYLYSALYFSRKWNLENKIDAATIAIAVPRSTIMRIYRSKLAHLLILLENSERFKVNRSTDLCAEIEGVVSKMGSVNLPFVTFILIITVSPWLLYKYQDLPFGSMPTWTMNYSYPLCLVLQITINTFMALDYVIMDTLKLSIMMQLKMHFKYLTLSVHELILNAKEDFCTDNALESCSTDDVPWPYLQKHLKKIVLHYNYVIEVARVTETVFNKCVLASFINLSILNCLILLSLSNGPVFNMQGLKLFIYISASSALFFADCYFTQLVVTENEAFAYSFYEIDFVGTCLTFQKCLILCMARAQKPVKFTIGKFAPLTMVAIVTVLKASYSYYTLLQSRRKH